MTLPVVVVVITAVVSGTVVGTVVVVVDTAVVASDAVKQKSFSILANSPHDPPSWVSKKLQIWHLVRPEVQSVQSVEKVSHSLNRKQECLKVEYPIKV